MGTGASLSDGWITAEMLLGGPMPVKRGAVVSVSCMSKTRLRVIGCSRNERVGPSGRNVGPVAIINIRLRRMRGG